MQHKVTACNHYINDIQHGLWIPPVQFVQEFLGHRISKHSRKIHQVDLFPASICEVFGKGFNK